ncbi:MAG TPA: DUF3455 domain-containing protein [Actinophytocola sp.]|uniref:DUF3455 domain-containing protein n=1 Tax=Actinophytocola sp. TaxID=1872138 RepID=UPI002DB5B0AA|nr:DUF3455 domain-containing protein [Actinophytocola sp.]HEU5473508.1 DUF3455 domain-containing protein [Actinophytocola sp.]
MRKVSMGLVAAVAAVGFAAGAVPASGGPESDQRGVPEQLRVPDGNRRIATMPARGVQTYQCTAGAWVFLQPDAILEFRGRAQVLHTRGPVWTSVRDGSSVPAAAVANAPVAGAIPQLLLQANGHRGPGLLAEVTYIQRLNTTGGLAPAGTCTDGATASVQYTADYTFWVAAG